MKQPVKMKDVFAFTFESDLSLVGIFVRLNTAGPWRWVQRDSERWGDYLSTRALPDPDYAIVKLIMEPGHFVLNVKFESSRADAQSYCDELQQTILTRVLPSIAARNIRPAEFYE